MKNKARASSVSRLPSSTYLVWLEWPEKCFRVDAEALRYLKSCVRGKGRVIRARSEAAFLRRLPEATHALVWNFKSEWFAKAPRLKVLATPAAGQELVPTKGPKGVKIHFGRFHGQIMAETVAAFMLAWCRGFFRLRENAVANDPWPRTWLSDKLYEVAGTKAVIAGYGNVGRAIGAKLSALGVEVTGLTRHGVFQRGKAVSRPLRSGQESASTLLKDADWFILALPSTTGTDDFLDAKLIRKLPRRCVVINVGRGNAVDEKALYAALRSHRLAGAYIDVRKHEPSGTVPEFGTNVRGLDALENCIITPHASAFSPRYLKLCLEELKDDWCL